MTIHELFEQHCEDQLDISADIIRESRLTNGSYSHPRYAIAFRMFKAGFEANQGEKMQVLGYLSKEHAHCSVDDETVFLSPSLTEWETEAVYIKHCDALNKGEKV